MPLNDVEIGRQMKASMQIKFIDLRLGRIVGFFFFNNYSHLTSKVGLTWIGGMPRNCNRKKGRVMELEMPVLLIIHCLFV